MMSTACFASSTSSTTRCPPALLPLLPLSLQNPFRQSIFFFFFSHSPSSLPPPPSLIPPSSSQTHTYLHVPEHTRRVRPSLWVTVLSLTDSRGWPWHPLPRSIPPFLPCSLLHPSLRSLSLPPRNFQSTTGMFCSRKGCKPTSAGLWKSLRPSWSTLLDHWHIPGLSLRGERSSLARILV